MGETVRDGCVPTHNPEAAGSRPASDSPRLIASLGRSLRGNMGLGGPIFRLIRLSSSTFIVIWINASMHVAGRLRYSVNYYPNS